MQLCSSLSILWHCFSLGLEWKLTFSSPVATAEFSKFAGILSAALSQHHLLGFRFYYHFPPLFKNIFKWLVCQVGGMKEILNQAFLLKHFLLTLAGTLSLLKTVIFVSILYTKYLIISRSLFLYICTMEYASDLYTVCLIPKLDYKLVNIKTCCCYFLASLFPWLSY